MSIVDQIGSVVGDFMDDGKLNGAGLEAFGGLDLSQFGSVGQNITSALGENGIGQLTSHLSSLNINPQDFLTHLGADKLGDLSGLLQSGNPNQIGEFIKGVMGR